MGNVELFELCETIPQVQCSLYLNQGIVYCTSGHLLRENEFSRHLHQWRLDALSIPDYVIKKGRPRGARHGKTEAQKEHFIAHIARRRCIKKNFEGIHDRFQKDLYIVIRKEAYYNRNIHLKGTTCGFFIWYSTAILSVRFWATTRSRHDCATTCASWFLRFQLLIITKWPDEFWRLGPDDHRWVQFWVPSSRVSFICHVSTTITMCIMSVKKIYMALVVFFIQYFMVAVEWPLVELINSFIKVNYFWARGMSGIKEQGDLFGRFLTRLLRVTLWQDFSNLL